MAASQDNSIQLFRKGSWSRWWKTASSILKCSISSHSYLPFDIFCWLTLCAWCAFSARWVGGVDMFILWKFPAASRLCIFVCTCVCTHLCFCTTPVKCSWFWCVRLPCFIFCVECHVMCSCVMYGWYHGSLYSSQGFSSTKCSGAS
jgi:hypothetical protein